ncbi:MAG: penicillin-binding protein 2 [Armatimonadetes bacterium]|nr:penicillin-binding protein 2 [Armatimonadota bacterium]
MGGDTGVPPGVRLRITLVACGMLALFAILANHLFTMQILEHESYAARARRNAVVVELEPAPRGRMLDRRGRLLVSNEPRFELSVVPGELEPGSEAVLSRALGVPNARVRGMIERARASAPLERLVLEPALSAEQLVHAAPMSRSLRGVFLDARAQRRYPGVVQAAHLFGTVGEISAEELPVLRGKGYAARDIVGKTGLEKQYDLLLRGRKGVRHLLIDVLGRTVRTNEIRPPAAGLTLQLTLDMDLQTATEKALAEKLSELRQQNGEPGAGAVIALEAQTGRVLALASQPQFDPRPFARGIKLKEYERLVADPTCPLVNRAIHSSFSPGSTFKIINSSAALQEGLCHPHSSFYCGGSYAGASCFIRSGHGGIGFEQSLALSCDVVYYRLGDQLGIGRLGRYCAAFGLGSPTGIDLPDEAGGLLPSVAWKQKALGEEWFGGDTINMSIGQGFLLVSPLQMAVATAAVANGGKVYRPYLLERALTHKGDVEFQNEPRLVRKVPVKPELLSAVRQGMRGAVVYGTGGAADSPLVQVAGKTGTVESFPSVSNRHGRNHVWFVSFAPYKKPELVVVVFLEKSGGYGGSNAAPVARTVIEAYFAGQGAKAR